MDYILSDISPLCIDIQSANDWYCCMKKCKSYNSADAKKCSQCQHEKCADCQGPISGLTQLIQMWVCCRCGDGPKVITRGELCVQCLHAMCASCVMV
ncbi:hypothetical protein BDW60DRAFT_185371, partial [Aspergillus nidulans var. acristatus]